MTMNDTQYKHQVALLIRIIPLVYQIKDFAVHGGTAINLFHQNLPRYSVDIDLTYIPIEPRKESLDKINLHLAKLKALIERSMPGIKVIHEPDIWKLKCAYQGAMVKIEVNGTKRGILGEVNVRTLCPKAREEFQADCKARLVPYSQLYGGKIAAALSRQHPRDIFDCKYMKDDAWGSMKGGLLLALLGSDKPIIESLAPHDIDQEGALENQFRGMTEIPISYSDYKEARCTLIQKVNDSLDDGDRAFLLSFEHGDPKWNLCPVGDLSIFPSVQWKLQNISKLKEKDPQKFAQGIQKLLDHLKI